MKIPISAYWRLLRQYLAPQRGAVLFMSGLLLTSIGLQLVGPQVMRSFIDALQAGAWQTRGSAQSECRDVAAISY